MRVGEAHFVTRIRSFRFGGKPIEDDVQVVDAGFDGFVAGKRRELVAAEVGSRRRAVLLLEVDEFDVVGDVTAFVGKNRLTVDGGRESAGPRAAVVALEGVVAVAAFHRFWVAFVAVGIVASIIVLKR